jgi:hypothetical protein
LAPPVEDADDDVDDAGELTVVAELGEELDEAIDEPHAATATTTRPAKTHATTNRNASRLPKEPRRSASRRLVRRSIISPLSSRCKRTDYLDPEPRTRDERYMINLS